MPQPIEETMPAQMGFPKELHAVEKAGVAERSHCMLTIAPTILLGYFPTSNQADKTGVKMNLGKRGRKGIISAFIFLFPTTQISSCIFILVGNKLSQFSPIRVGLPITVAGKTTSLPLSQPTSFFLFPVLPALSTHPALERSEQSRNLTASQDPKCWYGTCYFLCPPLLLNSKIIVWCFFPCFQVTRVSKLK